MAEWKKVITSGSNAELANLTATGADIKLTGLATGSNENVLLVDSSTGAVKRIAMADVTGTNTTYAISTSASGSTGANITLAGTNSVTQSIQLVEGNNIIITETGDAITIASTNDYAHPTQSAINVNQTALQTIDTVTVNTLGHVTGITSQSIQTASTSSVGVVQLSDSTTSTSTALAATANAVSSSMAAAATAQAAADAAAATAGAISSLSSEEIAQLANIGESTTIDSTQWGYLGATNQGLTSTSNVNFGTITATGNVSTTANVTGATASFNHLVVSGSATMDGSLVFNGVSFTETAIGTHSGSHVWGTDSSSTHEFTGSIYVSNDVYITDDLTVTDTISGSTVNAAALNVGGTAIGTLISNSVGTNITSVGTITTGSWNANTIAVLYGGTGVTSFADNSVIVSQDSGTNQLSAKAMTTTGSLLIGGSAGPEVGTLTQGSNITITNGNGTISIAGTADTQLTQSQVEDYAGGLFEGNTETGITATYQPGDNTVDLVVGGLTLTQFADNVIQSSSMFTNIPTDNEDSLVTAGGIIEYVTAATLELTGDTVYTAGDGLTLNTLDFDLDADLTTVTSIYNTGLKIGRAANDTTIDFGVADDRITFDAASTERLRVDTSGIKVYGAISASGDVTVAGNLQVNGTTTTVNSTIVEIDDAFISLGAAAGVANTDSGIIFGARNSDATTVAGDSLFWDGNAFNNDGRLAIDHNVAVGAITASADYYLAGAFSGSSTDAATALADHYGNLRIDAGEIYIYI